MSFTNQMPIIVSDKTELRRCVMHLWPSFNGLGLLLKYAKKSNDYPHNLIKDVEIGSPAHYAGVLNNDFIIKVGTRQVDTDKFDHVIKLIREQLRKEKKVDLLLVNSEYYDEFRRKYENENKKIDYNSTKLLTQIKNYQSPILNPNTTSKSVTLSRLNSDTPPEPRLCHLLTWSNYDGYGFYVAYNNDGVFVKNVEPNSPAQLGGLRDYDRIIEINGKQIAHTKERDFIMKLINKHKLKNGLQSVSSKSSHGTIKSTNTNYLDLFVADPNTYRFLIDRKVPLSTRNKSLKIQECFTPGEFTLATLVAQNSNTESPRTNSVANGSISTTQEQLNRSLIIKKCTVRRLRGKEDQPLGFEMTKRGNNPNFISRVEPGSSAALSGLCFEDYIIELNDKNVEQDENSLLKEKIFKCLEAENGAEFRFTTVNKFGFDYCVENQIKLSDLIQNNRQNIKYFETPVELSTERKPSLSLPPPPPIPIITTPNLPNPKLPRMCIINKTNENEELGISIARIKNVNEHVISDVIPNSLADRAGIRPNDCLLEVNGENVENKSHTETIKLIADLKKLPQARINLLVVEKPILANVNSLNKNSSLSTPNLVQQGSFSKSVVSMVTSNRNNNEKTQTVQQPQQQQNAMPSINVYPEIKVCEFLGYAKGTQLGLVVTSDDYSHDVVKVTENSPAFRAGLAKGDVIIAVNDQNVEGNASAIELLNDFSETKALRVLAASRYAFEWSKLLGIKITEKDWPNIKKFSTKHIPPTTTTLPLTVNTEHSYRHTNNNNNNHSIYSQSNYFDSNNSRNILMRNEVTTTSNLNAEENTRNIYYHHRQQQQQQQQIPVHNEVVSSTVKITPATTLLQQQNGRRVLSSASTIRSDHFALMPNLARSAVDITTDGRVLRLCTLVLDPSSPIPTDSEFGFDLVTKIGANQRIGDYYIDTVDMFSPACCSGLKPGDRLIEVDGIDVSNKTFEQVVQLINEAKLKNNLKLLVYPSVVINYGNPNLASSQVDSRSMPDLTAPSADTKLHTYNKQRIKTTKQLNNNEYDSIYYKKSTNLSKSSSNLYNYNLNSQVYPIQVELGLRPVPRLCTIYKNDSNTNIGFGVQTKLTSTIIPNYMRVSIVNYKSPAYLSGLEAGDFIVEINGRNTLTMSHEEALYFIKSSYDLNNCVKLLVVSEFCYNWLKENDLLYTLNSEDKNVFSYGDYLKNNQRNVPRLCKIRLYPFSKTFGFNIESVIVNRPVSNSNNNSKSTGPTYSHVISRVDRESPAYSSSLQKGDRIVECDGINVENDNEQQILDRIYQAFMSSKQINLFVVDPDTDNYFKSKCVKLHSMLPIVQHITNSTDI